MCSGETQGAILCLNPAVYSRWDVSPGKRSLGAVQGGGHSFRHFCGACDWLSLGRICSMADFELLHAEITCSFRDCVYSTAALTSQASASGLAQVWSLEASIRFVVSPQRPQVSVWLHSVSWSLGSAKKKGLLGRMPLGRLSLRKQHTLLFMVFS